MAEEKGESRKDFPVYREQDPALAKGFPGGALHETTAAHRFLDRLEQVKAGGEGFPTSREPVTTGEEGFLGTLELVGSPEEASVTACQALTSPEDRSLARCQGLTSGE